jgi:cyclase
MRGTRTLALTAAAVLVVLSGDFKILAQQRAGAAKPAGVAIRVLPIRGNVYLLRGGGANVVASVGKDGVVLVDTGSAATADTMLATVRELSRRVTAAPTVAKSCVGVAQGCGWWSSSEFLPTAAAPRAPRPIIGIINTSDDLDHIAGNAVIAAAGRTFGVRNFTGNSVQGAWIVAHENLTLRTGKPGEASLDASESYGGNEKKLNFINGEGVVVTHLPAAHTDGDSVVYFRGSDVLVAGDILNMSSYPVIDLDRGGSIKGVIDGLNWMLDLAVVEHMMEGGTMIVPGHGRLVDSADLAYYRDMVTIMRDRVREMRRRGMTLEQIKAARLSRDYDGRFGKNPAWTPTQFIEAIYRSLEPKA